MEDREIVALYLAREESAVTRTKEKYGARLRAFAARLLGTPADAEECENDTYFTAWKLIPPNEPYTYFYPFLSRILRHKALDRIRDAGRGKRAAQVEELSDELSVCIPGGESAEDAFDRKALSDALDRFLGGLSPEERTVFLRRYFWGEGIADAAGHMGWTESRTKSALFRLRNKLKEHLEKEALL